MMNNNIIISIDWDHTLRNLAGLDVSLLALIFYAKSKKIPVGLTTHRDIENTVLYTLYYWQFEKPETSATALAAAINYWHEKLFGPCQIEFDFINARYQPFSSGDVTGENYYKKTLLAVEKKLAEDIKVNHILESRAVVKNKISEYTKNKEPPVFDNEFKEAQIAWLYDKFAKHSEHIVIYHLDDCEKVCANLPLASDDKVKTICYKPLELFANETYRNLLEKIGLSVDLEAMLTGNGSEPSLLENPLRCLSLCLLATQINDGNPSLLKPIKTILQKIEPALKKAIQCTHLLSYNQNLFFLS